jgi:hypothetical protein
MQDARFTKVNNMFILSQTFFVELQQSGTPCENEKHSGVKLLQHTRQKFLTPIIQFLYYAFTLKPKLPRRRHGTATSQNQQVLNSFLPLRMTICIFLKNSDQIRCKNSQIIVYFFFCFVKFCPYDNQYFLHRTAGK